MCNSVKEAIDRHITNPDYIYYYVNTEKNKDEGAHVSILWISNDITSKELQKNKSKILKEIDFVVEHYELYKEIAYAALKCNYNIKDSMDKLSKKVYDYGFTIFHNNVTKELQCGGIFTYGKKVTDKSLKIVVPLELYKDCGKILYDYAKKFE